MPRLQAKKIGHIISDYQRARVDRLGALVARTAPGNQRLQIDLASVWLSRGWPRRAEAELKRVESMSPRNLSLETQQGTGC